MPNGTGTPELLLPSKANIVPTDWSRDGRFLLYMTGALGGPTAPEAAGVDIWMLPLGGDRKPVPVLQTNFNELQARLSPDGRWMAYVSDESGRFEIYVKSFNAPSTTAPTPEGKWLLSKGGGTEPRWSRDGRALFYLGVGGSVMAVDIKTTPAFEPGMPKPLFQIPAGATIWDVAPDGQRFLLPVLTAESSRVPFTVVLNWTSALKQ